MVPFGQVCACYSRRIQSAWSVVMVFLLSRLIVVASCVWGAGVFANALENQDEQVLRIFTDSKNTQEGLMSQDMDDQPLEVAQDTTPASQDVSPAIEPRVNGQSPKPTGLLHQIPVDPEELYFHKDGPLAEIHQGITYPHTFPHIAKTCRIYRHFATRGVFNVVKFNENLARDLADLKCRTRGLSKEEGDLYCMREVEELSGAHVFYMLADARDPNNTNLADQNCGWHVLMQVDGGSRIKPTLVTELSHSDFDAERRGIFGHDWEEISRAKALYRVTFPRSQDDTGKSCSLIFSAVDVEDRLTW